MAILMTLAQACYFANYKEWIDWYALIGQSSSEDEANGYYKRGGQSFEMTGPSDKFNLDGTLKQEEKLLTFTQEKEDSLNSDIRMMGMSQIYNAEF